MVVQVGAKAAGNRLADLDSCEAHPARAEHAPVERRGRDAACPGAMRKALTWWFHFIRSARHVQQALLPGLEIGPTIGKCQRAAPAASPASPSIARG